MNKLIPILILVLSCISAAVYQPHRRNAFRQQAAVPPFDPADLGSVVIRYDVNALGLNDGDPIATITDSSGNHWDGFQTTAANRPYWTNDVSILNNLGYAHFDGTDKLNTNYVTSYSQPLTAFIVARRTSGVDNANLAYFDCMGAANMQFRHSSSGRLVIASPTVIASTQFYLTNGTWYVFECRFNGAYSFVKTNDVTHFTGDAGANASTGFILGARYDGANPINGDIAYFLLYNRSNSVSESTQVFSWLTNRFNLSW